jgi:hypothetical protein
MDNSKRQVYVWRERNNLIELHCTPYKLLRNNIVIIQHWFQLFHGTGIENDRCSFTISEPEQLEFSYKYWCGENFDHNHPDRQQYGDTFLNAVPG